jgi:hypothetical protein
MNRLLSLALTVLPLSFTACVDESPDQLDESSMDQAATGEAGLTGAPEHLFHGRDAKPARPSGGGGGQSPLMTYGGGTVLHNTRVTAIFWGSEWSNPTFAGDKIDGIDTFFSGIGGSVYGATANEYYDTVGGVTTNITSAVSYDGHLSDTTAAPSKALTTNSAVAEACKMIGNNPDPNALYLIFTSTGAGHVSYCAWHSWGTCSNGKNIQVAYMPNIDGIAGCDPTSNLTGTDGHSQGLTALANVTAHELMEAISDPRGKGWTDSSGSENGDKCAWAFPPSGSTTFSNGSSWLLQGEWSNAAYTASTGYANRSGQLGCLPL